MRPATASVLALLLSTAAGNAQDPAPDTRRTIEPVADSRPAKVAAGRRHALLVGIDAYPVKPLKTPVADVQELARVLEQEYGFHSVEKLLNAKATGDGIEAALKKYASLSPDDDLLIYFGGHGQFDGREGYWIPHDAKFDVQRSWFPNATIRQLLGLCPARHILIVSDSCFSGSLTRGEGDIGVVTADYLRQLTERSAREVISSGDIEQVADGGYAGHSVFAYHLLRVLERSDPLPAALLHSALLQRCITDPFTPQRPAFGRFHPVTEAVKFAGSFVFERQAARQEPSPALKEGVPIGWQLPLGMEVVKEEDGSYSYVRRTGNDICRMRLVLPGAFPYGGDTEQRQIIARPFLIDEQEVTVERFRQFMRERRPAEVETWNLENYNHPQQPVVGVSLRTALEFAAWSGKLIPDEIHWEYAASWGKDVKERRAYPWGGGFDQVAPLPAMYPPLVAGLDKTRAGGPDQNRVTVPDQDRSAWLVLGMGSGVREWCVLPMDDQQRRDNGAIRGATQVLTGRRDLRKLTTGDREVAPSTDFAARDVGFRCILFLERWDGTGD
jgi:formylglycine-generating enzyme required for sulfatase activity